MSLIPMRSSSTNKYFRKTPFILVWMTGKYVFLSFNRTPYDRYFYLLLSQNNQVIFVLFSTNISESITTTLLFPYFHQILFLVLMLLRIKHSYFTESGTHPKQPNVIIQNKFSDFPYLVT